MIWPFSSRPVKSYFEDWALRLFGYFRREVDPSVFEKTELQVPNSANFPTNGLRGHELANHYLELVKARSGMKGWQCTLKSFDKGGGDLPHNIPVERSRTGAAGVFSVNESGVEIAYDEDLLRRPVDLISTFAHELGHYLLAGRYEKLPCEQDEWEHATDLAAIYMGWGVFILRSSSRYVQFSSGGMQGHGISGGGYLTANQAAFCLSVFLHSKGLEYRKLENNLSDDQNRYLRRSYKYLKAKKLV